MRPRAPVECANSRSSRCPAPRYQPVRRRQTGEILGSAGTRCRRGRATDLPVMVERCFAKAQTQRKGRSGWRLGDACPADAARVRRRRPWAWPWASRRAPGVSVGAAPEGQRRKRIARWSGSGRAAWCEVNAGTQRLTKYERAGQETRYIRRTRGGGRTSRPAVAASSELSHQPSPGRCRHGAARDDLAQPWWYAGSKLTRRRLRTRRSVVR